MYFHTYSYYRNTIVWYTWLSESMGALENWIFSDDFAVLLLAFLNQYWRLLSIFLYNKWRICFSNSTAQLWFMYCYFRSHAMAVREQLPETVGKRVFNLNVRGKRGNIVQVYPAVEYDFVPNTLHASVDDYIHIQWVQQQCVYICMHINQYLSAWVWFNITW